MGQNFIMIDGEKFFLVREGLLNDMLHTQEQKLAHEKLEILRGDRQKEGHYLMNEMDHHEVLQIQNDLNANRIQEYSLRGM